MSYLCKKTCRPYAPRIPKPQLSSGSSSEESTPTEAVKARPLPTATNAPAGPSNSSLTSAAPPPKPNERTPHETANLNKENQNFLSEFQIPGLTLAGPRPIPTQDRRQVASQEPQTSTIPVKASPGHEEQRPKTVPPDSVTGAIVPDAEAGGSSIYHPLSIPSDDEESDGSEYTERFSRRDRELADSYHRIWAQSSDPEKATGEALPKESVEPKRKRKADISGYCTPCKWRVKKCSADGGPGPCRQCKELSKSRGDEVVCVYDRNFFRSRAFKAGQRLPECYHSRPGVRRRPRSSVQDPIEEEGGPEIPADAPGEDSESPERPSKRLWFSIQSKDRTPLPVPFTNSPQEKTIAGASSGTALEPIQDSSHSESRPDTGLPSDQVSQNILNESSTNEIAGEALSSEMKSSDAATEDAPIHKLIENLKSQVECCTRLRNGAAGGGTVFESAVSYIEKLNKNLEDRELKRHLELEKIALSGKGVLPEFIKDGFIKQNFEEFKGKRDWA